MVLVLLCISSVRPTPHFVYIIELVRRGLCIQDYCTLIMWERQEQQLWEWLSESVESVSTLRNREWERNHWGPATQARCGSRGWRWPPNLSFVFWNMSKPNSLPPRCLRVPRGRQIRKQTVTISWIRYQRAWKHMHGGRTLGAPMERVGEEWGQASENDRAGRSNWAEEVKEGHSRPNEWTACAKA